MDVGVADGLHQHRLSIFLERQSKAVPDDAAKHGEQLAKPVM